MLKQKYLIAASACAVIIAAPAVSAQEQDRLTAEVSVADLDLSTAAGQASLDRRLELALRKVCPTDPHPDLRQQAEARACRAQAMQDVQPRLAELTSGGVTQLANRDQNYVAAR